MKRIVWLFCLLFPFILSAQETDLYKSILKETLKPESPLNFSIDFSDSIFPRKPIRFDVTKDYIPRLGFNYKQNALFLSYKDFTFVEPQKISPFLTDNLKLKTVDPSATEVAVNEFANVVLTPVCSAIMINPAAFFRYLMQIGVLSDKPFVPRKERMLKTITKDVYHIDDNY